MYKQNKMTQEQLRMQMLAGIITESQYKRKLSEVREGLYDDFNKWKESFPEGTKFENENGYMKAKDNADKELGKWNPITKYGAHSDDFAYNNL